jgi:hypothetical protein
MVIQTIENGSSSKVCTSDVQAKLEEELRIRDLDTTGNKQELVERLHAALTVFLVTILMNQHLFADVSI